ncbi:MAG: hypothetical protein KAW89_00285 [Armatimonadetes bacterium]|nr:hypothetical protein [Armatimonadota bacterium]
MNSYWSWNLIITGGVLLYVDARSLLSWTFLRRAPDFTHREEMMWGALWWPVIFTAVLATMHAAWTIAPNSVHHYLLGFTVPYGILLVLLATKGIGTWTLRGIGLIDAVWSAHWRGREFDLDAFLQEAREWVQWGRRRKWAIMAVAMIPWAVMTGIWVLGLFLG